MSFLGKKFQRVSSENLEELIDALKITDKSAFMLRAKATFWFSRVDDHTYKFELESEGRSMTTTFRLGEETHVERRDGSKAKVTYFMEGDNVLTQTNKPEVGKVTRFRREFNGNTCNMTITVDGCDIVAKLFYEAVE